MQHVGMPLRRLSIRPVLRFSGLSAVNLGLDKGKEAWSNAMKRS